MKIISPLRVNLIGEHTDYNQGLVLPLCIDLSTTLEFQPRADSKIVIKNSDFGVAEFDLNFLHTDQYTDQHSGAITPEILRRYPHWHQHILGIILSLKEHGFKLTRGFDATISSNAPIGAGLSSSTAFELSIARALIFANQEHWDPLLIAKLCQHTENHWIGVNCGLMDQLICTHGRANHASLIDFADPKNPIITPIPIPQNAVVVILDTGTRRGLVDSEYNLRREQCQTVAQFFNVPSLRKVKLEALFEAKDQLNMLDPHLFKRAHHVITENQRVWAAVEALQQNHLEELGILLNQSHQSLNQDFEVTNHALNLMVQIAQKTKGCYGARMTGAGFGGCAIAVVHPESLTEFLDIVQQEYFLKSGIAPTLYQTQAVQGCHYVQDIN
jgi:galactokinase